MQIVEKKVKILEPIYIGNISDCLLSGSDPLNTQPRFRILTRDPESDRLMIRHFSWVLLPCSPRENASFVSGGNIITCNIHVSLREAAKKNVAQLRPYPPLSWVAAFLGTFFSSRASLKNNAFCGFPKQEYKNNVLCRILCQIDGQILSRPHICNG